VSFVNRYRVFPAPSVRIRPSELSASPTLTVPAVADPLVADPLVVAVVAAVVVAVVAAVVSPAPP
jgi:hypothetical protein